MIAANTTTAQFLGGARLLRPSGGSSACPSGGRESSRSRRRPARNCQPSPTQRALEQWLLAQKAATPARFVDLSLAVVKLLGRGEYVVEPPNEPTPRSFRPCGR